ncbi:hypothetical protein TeGR_g7410, partial [Tetraparma gracilis]
MPPPATGGGPAPPPGLPSLASWVSSQKKLLSMELQQEQSALAASNKPANKPAHKRFGEEKEEHSLSSLVPNLCLASSSLGLYGKHVATLCPHDKPRADKPSSSPPLLQHRLSVGDEVDVLPCRSAPPPSCPLSQADLEHVSVTATICKLSPESIELVLGPATSSLPKSKKPAALDLHELSISDLPPPLTLAPRASVAVHQKLTAALEELADRGPSHPLAGPLISLLFPPSPP